MAMGGSTGCRAATGPRRQLLHGRGRSCAGFLTVGLAGPLVLLALRTVPQAFTPLCPPASLRPPARSAASSLAAEASEKSDAGIDERLLGAWRYPQGAYSIRESNGKIYFHENGMIGELQPKDGWLVTKLPPAGTIRLRLLESGAEVQSNFMLDNTNEWGDAIHASREWETLTSNTKLLKQELAALQFTGNCSGVFVTVDGQQQPVGLELSPEAAAAEDLGSYIKEAQQRASAESMDAMTEKLRELYARHFGVADVSSAA